MVLFIELDENGIPKKIGGIAKVRDIKLYGLIEASRINEFGDNVRD